jgi:hypothetical protein
MLVKAFIVCVLIMLAETVHGALRMFVLNPRFGDRRARQIGVFTGSAIFIVIAWATMPWIGAASSSQCLLIGVLWILLMLAFDIAFGLFYFRFSWQRMARDFDPRQGGLLGLGMVALFFTPLVVAKLRGLV